MKRDIGAMTAAPSGSGNRPGRAHRAVPRDDANPPGLPARAAALKLLHGVLQLGRPLDTLLGSLSGLPASDRALAHAAALAVLRRLPDLDQAIDACTPRPLPPDARARAALRLALAQVWAFGTPGHALVATTLPLLEGGPRRLAHAVLTRLLADAASPPVPPRLPAPWAERWAAAYGVEERDAIARALATEPPLDLTLRTPGETARWVAAMGGVSLWPGHVRLPRAGEVTGLVGFAEGAWWVQDFAASLPARLLGVQPGDRVLDMCAAPGGKTLQLAAAGARVTALDIAPGRMVRVRENLARTEFEAELVTADALAWEPKTPFDAVLLDAPCSATGTARRHPDVLHLKAARDLTPVIALQRALLDRATASVRPGGRLIYCVCSLEADEGEEQARAFLADAPAFRADPIGRDELPAGLAPTGEGWVRTLPHQLEGGLDGFFIARFRRL